MTSAFWKLPLNAEELVDSVHWAGGGSELLVSNASSTTVLEVLEQKESGALLLHMINYDSEVTPSLENVEISLRIPDGVEVGQHGQGALGLARSA